MAAFIRPENALKQADGLIAVGQKDQALQTLHDVITSKRHHTWSKVLEDIMKKYVQLCVDLRKGKFAKEGLHQYKLKCQVNINSLEVVIKHYLQIAEASAKEAQSKAKQTILDIEDLEAEESAESIMLTAVSGEDRTDRTDREIVTPWLRFLWETYRTVLETLRNSAKLEALYHETAQQAFNFCLRYQRKNEFRRLSDILRNHLTNLGKYPNQPQSISLNNAETLQVHLDTRFTQLNVATELELWQEAFRSVEDIHGLMTMSHKPLSAKMMETYFQRLARIFWVSNNYLFHAFLKYAWFKYFAIARASLKDKPDEISLASSVLLAALAIPLPDPKLADEQYFDYDYSQTEKNLRMGTLLGFNITPKRDYLLQDLISKKVAQMGFPELQDIYTILEKRFNPLQLCQKMAEKFAFIKSKPELAQYEEQLQKLTFLRLIQQLSQVYESMKIADFKKMVSFMDSHTIEKLLVSTVKRRFAGVRIDHQNGAIHFGGTGSESDKLRDQLTQLAKGLQQASKLIHPKPQNEEQYVKTKSEAFVRIIDSLKDMFAYYQNRRDIIEKRKLLDEQKQKDKQQAFLRQEQEKAKKEQNERIKLEERNRKKAEKKKKEMEIKAKQSAVVDNLLRPFITPGVNPHTIEDPEKFINEKIKQEQLAKKQQEQKLVDLGVELTHKERAQRECEKLLLVDQLEKKKVEDRAHYEQLVKKSEESQRAQHAFELAEKKRLSRMAGARAAFEERVMSVRKAEYEKLKADQERRLMEIKTERDAEKARIAQEEEERRKKIEEERAKAEEHERERKRIEEEKKAEEENKRKKLVEQAETQRKREQEIMQREKEREAEQRLKEEQENEKRLAEKKPEPWRRPGAGPADSGRNEPREEARNDDRWRPNSRDDRPRDDRPRDDRPRDDRPRDADRWGRRDEPARPREDDRWGRRDEPARPRDDRPRDDRPRDDRPREDDRWGRRDEPARPRDDDRWGRRDEPARPRDDRPREDDRWGRRDEPARPRDDDRWGRRDERPRDDRPRDDRPRDERPRDDRPRDDRPRDDRPRDDRVRDERPREDSWRRDDRRDERRDEPQRTTSWRKDDAPARRDEDRRDDRRESDRKPEPRESEKAPLKEKDAEPAKEEKKEKDDDGFSVVASSRRRGGRK